MTIAKVPPGSRIRLTSRHTAAKSSTNSKALTATTVWKQRPAEGGELERLVPGSAVNVNLRVQPEDGSEMRRELVARTFADVVEHEAWVGPATLELRPNAQVPVHLLAVREVVLGLHRVLDLSLPPGHVVHRYRSTRVAP